MEFSSGYNPNTLFLPLQQNYITGNICQRTFNIEYQHGMMTYNNNEAQQLHSDEMNQLLQNNSVLSYMENPHSSSTSDTSQSNQSPAVRKKRHRTQFTKRQLLVLEAEFKRCPFLLHKRRRELSSYLSLGENQIKVWFQNMRMKDKRNRSAKARAEQEDHDSIVKRLLSYQKIATDRIKQEPVWSEFDDSAYSSDSKELS